MEILRLQPAGMDYLLGGIRLRNVYGKKIDVVSLAEIWECLVHSHRPNIVSNGEYRGMTMPEAFKAHTEWMETKIHDGQFTILVKFIDAKKDLAVQVYPDALCDREHEQQNGKNEMWYITDSDEGAQLIYGFHYKVDKKMLRKTVETGTSF